MGKSIGDGPTMRPKDECGGHGVFIPGDVIARRCDTWLNGCSARVAWASSISASTASAA